MNAIEPIVGLNEHWQTISDASIAIFDLGLWGLAATEMLRTYGGRPVLVDRHVDRLIGSAAAMRFDHVATELPSGQTLKSRINETIERNQSLAGDGGDLGLSICISAGIHSHLAPREITTTSGTVAIVPFKLPLTSYQQRLRDGQHLVVSSVRQVSEASVPGHIKSRSRIHWRLAEIDVCRQHANAVPLLLDHDDRITETSTSNVFVVKDGTLMTPARNVLRGISRAIVLELAAQTGITALETDLTPADIMAADEVFTTSSLLGLCPVTRFNGESIAGTAGIPDSVRQKLTQAFSQHVGIDIVGQIMNAREP